MKYGKVLTYKDVEEAKKLIGKKVLVSDSYMAINGAISSIDVGCRTLVKIGYDTTFLFVTDAGMFQFIREVIEEDEPKRMTNRQLSEWLARGNGEVTQNISVYSYTYRNCYKEAQDNEVDKDIRIRSWGSEEWVIPTKEIYERDCVIMDVPYMEEIMEIKHS